VIQLSEAALQEAAEGTLLQLLSGPVAMNGHVTRPQQVCFHETMGGHGKSAVVFTENPQYHWLMPLGLQRY
jgi:hypothetical protein